MIAPRYPRSMTDLGPHARQFAELWGPRARGVMRVLTGVTLVLLVTWLLGLTSFRTLVVAVVARLLVPAIYGGLAGRAIAKDRAPAFPRDSA